MEIRKWIVFLVISGLVMSGMALAQSGTKTDKLQPTKPLVATDNVASTPIKVPAKVQCWKTNYDGCINIECDDGFTLKQCQNTCRTYVDEYGCTVTVCNGVETRDCPGTSEKVTCAFLGSAEPQKCYSGKGSCTAYPKACADGEECAGAGYMSCTVAVSGKIGETIYWKSTCGGSGQTTVDGVSEAVKFDCSQTCREYTDGNGCVVRECPDGMTSVTCPTCKEYKDEKGCLVRECANGTPERTCPSF